MLSTGAFNALLKTLEEPPEHVKFVLATTDVHKVPETILSRCQRFDFRLIPARSSPTSSRKVADGEGIALSAGPARLSPVPAEGGMRDALSLLDQVRAAAGPRRTTRPSPRRSAPSTAAALAHRRRARRRDGAARARARGAASPTAAPR